MLPTLLLLAAGALFANLPRVSEGGAIVGALLPVVLTIAFAVAASGRVNGTAVGSGAIAAFAGSVAWALVPALGGALVVAVAYAERTMRVRSVRAKGAHIALGLLAGGAAGALAQSYADGPVAFRAVAVVMCAVLSTLPLIIEADDPRVVFLESAAMKIGAPVALTLLDGVALLRCGDLSLLDRETAANVKKSWRSLDKLVLARLRMQGGKTRRGETEALVTAMVDRQITEHVASLTRAYAAVTTMGAAATGLDDSALRVVHARGEALEEQSRAMVEVGRG